MTNIAHSTLSGSDLHEPKGIGSAAANTLYVANGAGSGSWTQVPLAALAAGTNAFANGALQVIEFQAQGVNGGTPFAPNAYTTCILNTQLRNDAPAVYTLNTSINAVLINSAGTYYAELEGLFGVTNSGSSTHQQFQGHHRLFDITHGTTLVDTEASVLAMPTQNVFVPVGSGISVNMGVVNANLQTKGVGTFTLSAPAYVTVQGVVNTSANSGYAAGFSGETYTNLRIWKIT